MTGPGRGVLLIALLLAAGCVEWTRTIAESDEPPAEKSDDVVAAGKRLVCVSSDLTDFLWDTEQLRARRTVETLIPLRSSFGSHDESYAGRLRRILSGPQNLLQAPDEELWILSRDSVIRPAQEEPGPMLWARRQGSDCERPLAPESTRVTASVAGMVASVRVVQRFGNPAPAASDAMYVFPLPPGAAVGDFLILIGERRIRGIVREREDAERIYHEARSQGYLATLLTQERPNVFTQKLGNLEPGKPIDIEVTYFDVLPYREGSYVFSFPLVVDSHTPRTVSLNLDLDAGSPIESVVSPTHEIKTERISESHLRITPTNPAVPGKAFVLRYSLLPEEAGLGLLTHPEPGGGTFLLVLQPPAKLRMIPRQPRELVFVLDCSRSLEGAPLATAKRAIERLLTQLDSDDSFQILRASAVDSDLGPGLLPATPENIQRGQALLSALQIESATNVIPGVRAALDYPQVPGRQRMVSLFTDGVIGSETELLQVVHQRLGSARVFGFGVGAEVNQVLLEGLAKVGRGAVSYLEPGNPEAMQVVEEFFESIAFPVLTDITFEWEGQQVQEVYPGRFPDLFPHRPVILAGRYTGDAGGLLRVRGNAGGRPVQLTVQARTEPATPRPALLQLWARMKIGELMDRARYEPDVEALAAAIRKTALAHGLLSPLTAFVSVDSSRRTGGE